MIWMEIEPKFKKCSLANKIGSSNQKFTKGVQKNLTEIREKEDRILKKLIKSVNEHEYLDRQIRKKYLRSKSWLKRFRYYRPSSESKNLQFEKVVETLYKKQH